MTFDPYKTLHQELERAISEYGIESAEASEADKSLWETAGPQGVPHIGTCTAGTGRVNWSKNCSCSLAPAIHAHFEYGKNIKAILLKPKFDIGRAWLTATDGNKFEQIARALTPTCVRSIRFHKSLSGSASQKGSVLLAPCPKTRRALHIYLHECAHFVMHHPVHDLYNQVGRSRNRKGWEYEPGHPKYIWEYQVAMWAQKAMRKYGVTVPKERTAHAKAYVKRRLDQAVRAGLREIDPEIARWCGWKGWSQGKFTRRKADAPEFVPVPEVQLHNLVNRPTSSNEAVISVMKTPTSGAEEAATMSIPSGYGRQDVAVDDRGPVSLGVDGASGHAFSLDQSSVAILSEREVETTDQRTGVGRGQADI